MSTAVRPDPARNRRVATYALTFAMAMLGLGYASVPLYRLFCQATGFGGTTQRATEAQAAAVKVSPASRWWSASTATSRGGCRGLSDPIR